MGDAVTQAIAQGTSRYLVLDCPLARDHPRFAAIIDLAVFIDTPLDVALARRQVNGRRLQVSHALRWRCRFKWIQLFKLCNQLGEQRCALFHIELRRQFNAQRHAAQQTTKMTDWPLVLPGQLEFG